MRVGWPCTYDEVSPIGASGVFAPMDGTYVSGMSQCKRKETGFRIRRRLDNMKKVQNVTEAKSLG